MQLLPAGEFHAVDGRPRDAGSWRIDAAVAAAVIERVRSRANPLVVDYEHQTLLAEKNGQPAPAAGWFKALEWREGQGLFATDVEWTARAKQMIDNGEYRYISPVIRYDKKTGAVRDIQMAAITNTPAIDGMADLEQRAAAKFDLTHSSDQENDVNELLKSLLATLGMPETTKEADAIASVAALKATADKSTALEGEVAALKTQTPDPAKYVPIAAMQELQTQVAALSAANVKREVDDVVDVALSEGKLLLAQEAWARELGSSNLAALKKYLETAQPIAALRGTQTRGKGPGLDTSGDPVAAAKAEWDGNAALRSEFVDLESYTAYRKANAEGRVRILGRQAD